MILGRLEEFLGKRNLNLRILDQDHLIDWFSCGRDTLMDAWLSKHAREWQAENLCQVWVLTNRNTPGDPIGFFTLSSHQVTPASIPKPHRAQVKSNKSWVNNLDQAFPATLLGKFALERNSQGQGFGEVLMLCAYTQHLEAASHSSAKFLVLDVQNDSLAEYYSKRFGFFRALNWDGPGRMIKATKTIETELIGALRH
ncbi:MAG: hypothetical protein Q4P66_08730 [Actinomycetaceae bacterium]|nr:hypothetical protein [Actinomycetaceae bacterium]